MSKFYSNIYPESNRAGDIGVANKRFKNIYTVNIDASETGSIGTLDANYINVETSSINYLYAKKYIIIEDSASYSRTSGSGTPLIKVLDQGGRNAQILMELESSSSAAGLRFRTAGNNTYWDWFLGSTGEMRFDVNGTANIFHLDDDAPANSIWIDSTGVGIHTDSPTTELQVDGTISGSYVSASEGFYSGSVSIGGLGSSGTKLSIHAPLATPNNEDNFIRFGDLTGNRHGKLRYYRDGSNDNDSYTDITGKGNTSGHLIIKGDGNVGIGNTDPSHKLTVDGDASASVFIGSRSYLSYGYNTEWTEDATNTTSSALTVDGAENGQGYRMIRNGVVTGLSMQFDCTLASAGASFRASVQVNGTTTNMTVNDACSATGDRGQITTTNPQSFGAGDTINVELILDESGVNAVTVDDIACLVEIKT